MGFQVMLICQVDLRPSHSLLAEPGSGVKGYSKGGKRGEKRMRAKRVMPARAKGRACEQEGRRREEKCEVEREVAQPLASKEGGNSYKLNSTQHQPAMNMFNK